MTNLLVRLGDGGFYEMKVILVIWGGGEGGVDPSNTG